jgi:hypothetical protein
MNTSFFLTGFDPRQVFGSNKRLKTCPPIYSRTPLLAGEPDGGEQHGKPSPPSPHRRLPGVPAIGPRLNALGCDVNQLIEGLCQKENHLAELAPSAPAIPPIGPLAGV